MTEKQNWVVRDGVRYVEVDDNGNVTDAAAMLLNCPKGHPLVFRAMPAAAAAYANHLHCQLCPTNEQGEHPAYRLLLDKK